MKRSEVRTFIRDGVNSITPVLDYWEGDIQDFNAQRSNEYPGVLLILDEDTTTLTQSAPQDQFSIKLIIANIDRLDSNPEVYEAIVDSCHEIAHKLIYKYRNIIEGYKLVTLESIQRKRFVKLHADCLTGIELSFTINAPDKTDVC